MVFLLSGYSTKMLMDYFISPDASKLQTDKQFLKKMKTGMKIVGEGIYKNEEQIQSELHNLQEITSDHLKSQALFPKGKSFFVQIVPDEQEYPDAERRDEMHPHYYWLKKTLRKMGLPLFAYKIEAAHMKDNKGKRMLKEVFKVQS